MSINTKKYIEEFLKIKDKNSRIIQFKLNEPQNKLYNTIRECKKEHKPVRILILKARQMGFSTLTEAILFKEVVTKHNVSAGIIAHIEEATTNLYTMSKLYYQELPDAIKPQVLNSNAKELIFNNKEGTGLNSKIRCMTAGTQGAGRSGTYNFLHLSEFAFWQGDKKATLNGLMQTVPKNEDSMVIIESTANGYEYFKELWDKAVQKENDFIPFFVGWNELEEYKMPYSGFTLTNEEKILQERYNLSLEQLEWRRWCIKNNCGGDVELFHQEYPISPEEAFLSTGKCVFDKDRIYERLAQNLKPIKTGYFEYDYDDSKPAYGMRDTDGRLFKINKISNIRWKNDPEGYIKIYELPNTPEVVNYAIGGDTAGEGSDYFTAHVINSKTLRQCATLRKQMDSDLYAKQVYCLAMYYNKALVGIENNFDSFPIRELTRLGYLNQFVREKEDSITHKIIKQYGFRTDLRTRPAIIDYLKQVVRDAIELIYDYDTLKEMLEFVYNDNGRPEAQIGSHDDLVMGLAIAYRIVTQVKNTPKPIQVDTNWFFKEDKPKTDKGERIRVV